MVEFISLTHPNASTELDPVPGSPADPEWIIRYSRALDDYGFNYTLVPYHSGGFDPFTIGATILASTKQIRVVIALRPNTIYPTVAAKALATLEQLGGGGRVVVHMIAGGSDVEQGREGDFLTKEQRYAREEEYIQILQRAWKSSEPFSWKSPYYTFNNFSNGVIPHKKIPVSVGGSSDDAYRIGGKLGDIFGLWGEPLAETKEQIEKINYYAEKAGRPREEWPRIWVTFRPITAETDELAWQKAHRTLDALQTGKGNGAYGLPSTALESAKQNGTKQNGAEEPQNVGSQRLLAIAAKGDVHDRGLWFPTVTATNARGASTALVGSWQTVIDSLVDYVDIGADLISIRGYDNFNDAVEYGTRILPGVREVLARREAEAGNKDKEAKVNGVNGTDEQVASAASEDLPKAKKAKLAHRSNGITA